MYFCTVGFLMRDATVDAAIEAVERLLCLDTPPSLRMVICSFMGVRIEYEVWNYLRNIKIWKLIRSMHQAAPIPNLPARLSSLNRTFLVLAVLVLKSAFRATTIRVLFMETFFPKRTLVIRNMFTGTNWINWNIVNNHWSFNH